MYLTSSSFCRYLWKKKNEKNDILCEKGSNFLENYTNMYSFYIMFHFHIESLELYTTVKCVYVGARKCKEEMPLTLGRDRR